MKGLKSLSLSSSKVTDAGLAILKEMKGLEHLDSSGTKVTDDGLTQLKEMKGLQTLHLQGPRVTDVGIADLQAALPNTKIIGYGEKAVAPDRRALLLALVEKHSAEALSQLEVALGLDDPEHVNQYNHNVEQQFLVLGKDAFPIILELYRDPDFSLHSKLDDLLQSVGEDSAEFKSEAIRLIKLAQPDEFNGLAGSGSPVVLYGRGKYGLGSGGCARLPCGPEARGRAGRAHGEGDAEIRVHGQAARN